MRWVVLLAGCGRLGFDESPALPDAAIDAMPCIPAGTHDEDADGVLDSCDVCPHLAGPQTDGDGDRVGDACDPEPDVPRQRIAMFDPLTSLSDWTAAGTFTLGTGAVKLAGTAAESGRISRPFVPGNDTITIGVQTGARGAGQHLFALLFVEAFGQSGQSVYCEQYSDGTDAALLVTYTLDGSFMHPDGVVAPPIPQTAARLTATIDPATLACTLATNAVELNAAGARPPEIVPVTLAIYAENVITELDYIVQIRTDP